VKIESLQETSVEPAFSRFFEFTFDEFQLEAIGHIRNGRSVMVAAPTSSGKTLVAEYGLWRALESGSRAIYTTPIKALSNQKRHDLEQLFPGKVGLLTGDRSEHPDAPIVVMTTEVLRNMLVESAAPLTQVSCVVFDEVHYLADPDRGTVWEESIITCPQHVQLICLSATIANANEVAAWIGETHREVALVRHDERPIPLEHFYFTQGKLHLVRDEYGERRAMFPREARLPAPYPALVVGAMAESALLPAIWFAFSRQAVEDAAGACARAAPPLDETHRERIEAALAWTLDTLPEEDRRLPQLSALIHLLRRGVAFHHAGLLPPLKELVERLFAQGSIAVVCATDTLAVGINMPARTVVISCLSRPFGGMLTPNDFSQLTGRAGRRGIDHWGAVVMIPSKFHTFEQSYREVTGPLQPILSAFRLRYSTLLSAMEGREERLQDLVRKNLRQYQMKARARRAERQLASIRQRLEEHGYQAPPSSAIGGESLDEVLRLQTELAAAEREQKRARKARSKSPKSQEVIRRYEQAQKDRDRLETELRAHPLRDDLRSLERRDPELLQLLRDMQRLRAELAEADAESTEEALRTAEAVRAVLTRLRYIDQGELTRKARGMREIVSASGIVISELYEDGAFAGVSAPELAEVISWFAADSPRRRYNHYRLPKKLQNLRKRAQEVYRFIDSIEERESIDLAQGPSEWFYGVALDWCRGASIGDITNSIEMGEGDIVSLLNKTVDLLDQFQSMVRVYGNDDLLVTTREAHCLLVRGLVAMVRDS
jgi:superfamily II RNA helicase